jgi:hypothetical protein
MRWIFIGKSGGGECHRAYSKQDIDPGEAELINSPNREPDRPETPMRWTLLLVLCFGPTAFGEQFDYYTNAVLLKGIADPAFKEVKQVTADEVAELTSVLSDSSSAMLVVVTNDRRFCKLLAQPARQKLPGDKQVNLLLVDKFVTFRGTTERATQATGGNVYLFPGLRMSLDLGQVVPEAIGGDLQVVPDPKNANSYVLKPIGEAKLYVLAKPLAGVVPKKAPKLVPGEAFEARFVAGRYKLQDDGRRSGELKLEVAENGEISGTFVSDKDGREYDVAGKIGSPKHALSFSIKFPATQQTFTGFIFTGNGKVIAGTSKMQDREAAFSAERIEKE